MSGTTPLVFLIWLCGATAALAQTEHRYWPGFKGVISQFSVPLEAAKPEERLLKIKIRLASQPKAKPVAFDNAFHAVCKRHQGRLLKAAKKLSPAGDWRVWIAFEWPVKTSGGISLISFQAATYHLSSCRKV